MSHGGVNNGLAVTAASRKGGVAVIAHIECTKAAYSTNFLYTHHLQDVPDAGCDAPPAPPLPPPNVCPSGDESEVEAKHRASPSDAAVVKPPADAPLPEGVKQSGSSLLALQQ